MSLNSLPEKAEAINIRLAQISNELRSLDAERIEADFQGLYRAILNGAQTHPGTLDSLAARLVTVPLRNEVLEQLAKEMETELAELKARQKVLARKLGQKI